MAVYKGKIDVVNMTNITATAGNGIQETQILYAVSQSGVAPPDLVGVELKVTDEQILTFADTGSTFHVQDNKLWIKQGEFITYLNIENEYIAGIVGENNWSSIYPEVPQGMYLWTKTIYKYTNGLETVTYSVFRQGMDGPEGKPGPAGAAASSFRLECNSPEILKFVDLKGDTSISPGLLEAEIIKGDSNQPDGQIAIDITKEEDRIKNLANFKVRVYEIKTGSWYEVPQQGIISINDLSNKFNIDLEALISYGLDEERPDAGALLYSECILEISYKHIELSDDEEPVEKIYNLVEFLNVRYGMNSDMASLSVKASNIVAAIKDTKMEFGEEGLTIQNGAFQIVGVTEVDGVQVTTPLLYSDGENLAIKGKLDAATGTFAGSLSAANGTFTGTLQAAGGTFTGKLDAADISSAVGVIGGFHINEGYLYSDKADEFGNPNIKLNGSEGLIEAENIILGTGAKIRDFIQVGKTVKIQQIKENDDLGKSFISITDSSNPNQEILSVKANGSMAIGGALNQIIIDGANGLIRSDNFDKGLGWKISSTESIFNDVIVRGSIKASVLEYGEVQAVGGELIVRPSSRIISSTISEVQGQTILVLESLNGFEVNDYCRVDNGLVRNFYKIISVDSNTRTIVVEGMIENAQGHPVVNFGHTYKDESGNIVNRSIGIGISGTPNTSEEGSLITPQSISVFEFDETTFTPTPRVVLGKLPKAPKYGYAGGSYGLYAENVLLKGSLVTQTETGGATTYSGISTLYTGSNVPNSNNTDAGKNFANPGEILLWAGAPGTSQSDIENSSFFVDRNGNLFAGSGYFKGTIITDATITASAIETATLRGSGETPALTIEDAVKGIHFVSFEDNLIELDVTNQSAFLDSWKKEKYELEDFFTYRFILPVQQKERYFLSFGNRVDKVMIKFYLDSELKKVEQGKYSHFESFYIPEGVNKVEVSFSKVNIKTIQELFSLFNAEEVIAVFKKYINVFEVTKNSITANVSSFNLNSNFAIGNNGSLIIPNLYIVGSDVGARESSTKEAIMMDKHKIAYTNDFDSDDMSGGIKSQIDLQDGIKFGVASNNILELDEQKIVVKEELHLESSIMYGAAMEYRPIKNDEGKLIGYDLFIE